MSEPTSAGDKKPPDEAGSASAVPEAAGPDPAVAIAFALGWQMRDLYAHASPLSELRENRRDRLPGLSGLQLGFQTQLGLDQVCVALHRLSDRFVACAEMPDLKDVQAIYKSGPKAQLEHAIYKLHVELLTKLHAADFRLGKAYGLGRALGDSAHVTREDVGILWHEGRINQIQQWLSDLSSVFPPHAARPVAISIDRWEHWLKDPKLEFTEQLLRQGRRWRALLSDEKRGTDMLSSDHYAEAADLALRQSRKLTRILAKRFLPVALFVLVLLVTGIVFAFASTETAKILAGAGAAASALGFSWKTVGTGLAVFASRAGDSLWGAAIDEVIAQAITTLPDEESPPLVSPAGPDLALLPPDPQPEPA